MPDTQICLIVLINIHELLPEKSMKMLKNPCNVKESEKTYSDPHQTLMGSPGQRLTHKGWDGGLTRWSPSLLCQLLFSEMSSCRHRTTDRRGFSQSGVKAELRSGSLPHKIDGRGKREGVLGVTFLLDVSSGNLRRSTQVFSSEFVHVPWS